MRTKLGKFFLAVIIHGVLLSAVYLIFIDGLVEKYGFQLNSLFFLMVHVFLCIVYFFIIWSRLYAFDYNYFLSNGRETVLKSLVYVILIVAGAIGGIFGLSLLRIAGAPVLSLQPLERYLALTLVIVNIDILGFLMLYLLQVTWIRHLIGLGYLKKNLLVIGDPDERFPLSMLDGLATRVCQGRLVRQRSSWFFIDKMNNRTPVPGNRIQELLFEKKIGEVIVFLCDSLSLKHIDTIISILAENSINYYLVPDVGKLSRASVNETAFPYIPIIRKSITKRDSVTRITVKRLLDLLLVSLSMFVVAPLVLLIAFWIRVVDGGPVYYAHQRVGKNGRLIKFMKFRTMVNGADSMKERLLQFNSRGKGPLFKMRDDPRVTRIGAILRKYSLDELPQLFNVLRGDMSLVGPRPHLISEVSEYGERDMLRLECIPGITCFPQVYGRDDLSFRKWIEMDLSYRKNWSNALDFKILFMSLGTIVSPLFRINNGNK